MTLGKIMHSKPEIPFYEDMAESLRYWTNTGVSAMTNRLTDLRAFEDPQAFRYLQERLGDEAGKRALASALRSILVGHAHSFLVSLDGGTKMADVQRLVVETEDGRRFSDELHEEFACFLAKNEKTA